MRNVIFRNTSKIAIGSIVSFYALFSKSSNRYFLLSIDDNSHWTEKFYWHFCSTSFRRPSNIVIIITKWTFGHTLTFVFSSTFGWYRHVVFTCCHAKPNATKLKVNRISQLSFLTTRPFNMHLFLAPWMTSGKMHLYVGILTYIRNCKRLFFRDYKTIKFQQTGPGFNSVSFTFQRIQHFRVVCTSQSEAFGVL